MGKVKEIIGLVAIGAVAQILGNLGSEELKSAPNAIQQLPPQSIITTIDNFFKSIHA